MGTAGLPGPITIKNRTPHEVRVHLPGAERPLKVLPEPPEGLARVKAEHVQIGVCPMGGLEVPVYRVNYGEIVGLPDPVEDVRHIVSMVVAEAAALAGRPVFDLLVPASGHQDVKRDPTGQIFSVPGFVMFRRTDAMRTFMSANTRSPTTDALRLSEFEEPANLRKDESAGEKEAAAVGALSEI